ncbi:MAG: nucleotidyltransferase family protein [Eubacteriales bacterium]|nr:nucleotidyltransferase family protein [Eubacteriales bacterium]
MEQIYQTYLNIIKNICTDSNDPVSVTPEQLPALANLAQEHCTVPFVLPCLRSASVYPSMKHQVKEMMLNYYQIEHFTRTTVSLLRENHIDCYLLKGLSLADCYPVPEYRKLGDLDLYLAKPEILSQAQTVLESNGYILQDELSDHHVTYYYTFPKTGRRFILELHYRVVGQYQYSRTNEIVDSVYSPAQLKKPSQMIHGYSYTVLPPTEYVFYMIHHMLKHYLYSGFGIRLLCDFTFYLKHHESEIDFDQIHTWCRESRISHLYEIILESCRMYLGLPASIDPQIHYDTSDCQDFITQILKDGDMGTDVSQTLVGSSSYQKVNLFTYFREGHVQMKVRFPKASRFPVLWPVLWVITFVCFIRNTYKVRNTTFLQTLRNFKKSNQKTKLVKIFENSDS